LHTSSFSPSPCGECCVNSSPSCPVWTTITIFPSIRPPSPGFPAWNFLQKNGSFLW
jgi:hypothetical protein